MEDFNFVLSSALQEIDPLGENYLYKATQHPSAEDLLVVHFEEDGKWSTANYTKKEVSLKINAGHWIRK